jgi:hypothetical protein
VSIKINSAHISARAASPSPASLYVPDVAEQVKGFVLIVLLVSLLPMVHALSAVVDTISRSSTSSHASDARVVGIKRKCGRPFATDVTLVGINQLRQQPLVVIAVWVYSAQRSRCRVSAALQGRP